MGWINTIISVWKLFFISFLYVSLHSVAYADSRRVIEYDYDQAGNLIQIESEIGLNPPVITNINPSTIPIGPAITVTAALGDFFSNFAMGERVKVTAVAGQGSQTTFITISGEEFTVPSNAVAMQ